MGQRSTRSTTLRVTDLANTVPERITSLHRFVAQVYAESDAYFKDLEQEANKQDIFVACTAGCAACCSYIVSADYSEAMVIAKAIEVHPKRDVIVGRMMTWVLEWGQHSNDDPYGIPGPNVIAWQVKCKACPMLDPRTHLCMIYEQRPIACRVYHACAPKDNDFNPCSECATPTPPQDCFTTPTHAKHGHAPWVYMMRTDMITQFSTRLADLQKQTMLGVMPVLVFDIGAKLYGWNSKSIKMRPLYKLTSSFSTRG